MTVPLTLPPFLHRRIEALAQDFIHAGSGPRPNFSVPAGEEALVPPHSVTWRVFKNPLTLFIGGIAAVVLELGEPRVRAGVWDHTSFRKDPLLRLRRTGLAAMMTVYGPRRQAIEMIEQVNRLHGRISGVTPCGQPYRATDRELLDWVHATASFGFLEAYVRYAQQMSDDVRDRYYQEGAISSRLYGALGAPLDTVQLQAMFESMENKLESSTTLFEFLNLMQSIRLLPWPASKIQSLLVKAAIEVVPDSLRIQLGLGENWSLRPRERILIRSAAAAADRVVLVSAPAVQSCRRLGLPDNYLYQ